MDIHDQLYAALISEQPLQNLHALAKVLLANNWRRDQILVECENLLRELRKEGKESEEDIILDLMDSLTGFSSSHMRL